MNNTETMNVSSNANSLGGLATGMFPVYYVPTQQRNFGDNDFLAQSRYHGNSENMASWTVMKCGVLVQYMPGMIYNYNPIFPAPPIICSPLPVLPIPVGPSLATVNPDLCQNNTANLQANVDTIVDHKPSPHSGGSVPQFQRPASQATSVKAEPGSALGSIASASVANKVSTFAKLLTTTDE